MTLKPKEIKRLLEKNGFELINIKGSHYRYRHPDGRWTEVPFHGNKELNKGLERGILRQAKLEKK
ncbi:MAG: type II toxin-antitoxin system HicA family toxin [Lactobacillaceae bacterium]|jgi:predicted RNA binding protein YcfA (HicA-like mRNA interferase family)|nr:type II toxin-antitoxin system HicA family toxin [Lactobacillaceae bacterium]